MNNDNAVTQSLILSRVRLFGILCWTGILITIFSHQLLPVISINGAITAIVFIVPLLLPFVGLVRGDRYTYKWATLCVLPYFIVGVTESVVNRAAHRWAITLLGLSLLWFFSLITYLRVSRGQLRINS